jgi:glycerophosphoryl diester phosphodiesterase
LVAAFLFAAGSGATAPSLTVDVYAHRGGAGLAPENTLAAFRHALTLGADVLELDVHVSKDGELVVIHDFTLPRTTNGQGYVREASLADLKRLDAGARFDPRFAGERIPTLQEVLDLVKMAGPRVRLAIETKYPSPGEAPMPPADMEERLVRQVRAAGLAGRAMIESFYYPSLVRVKTIDPGIVTVVLRRAQEPTSDPVGVVREAKGDVWSPNAGLVTREAVDTLHRAGIPVVPWTVNAPAEMERLLDAGIGRLRGDGIITNYPDRLIQVLKARGIRP